MGKLEDKKAFIDNIVDSTLSGDLKWVAEKSIFNTYKRQKYKLSLDKNLYISHEVNLDSPEQSFYLYENSNMVDTFYYGKYSKPRYDNLKSVSDFLHKDFLKNVKRDIPDFEKIVFGGRFLIDKIKEDFYNDLSKNFTKKSFRKNKLENILSESPTSNFSSKLGNSEVKSEIKKEVKSEASDDSSMKKLENESLWLLSIPILGILHYFVTSDSVDNKYLPVIYSYFLLQIAFIVSIILR